MAISCGHTNVSTRYTYTGRIWGMAASCRHWERDDIGLLTWLALPKSFLAVFQCGLNGTRGITILPNISLQREWEITDSLSFAASSSPASRRMQLMHMMHLDGVQVFRSGQTLCLHDLGESQKSCISSSDGFPGLWPIYDNFYWW